MNKGIFNKVIIITLIVMAIVSFLLYINFTKNNLTKKLMSYVTENYPQHNLQLKNMHYSLSFGEFICEAYDPKSDDINFTIVYNKNGDIIKDYYDEFVASGFNTQCRLESDLTKKCFELLNTNKNLNIKKINCFFDDFVSENSFDIGAKIEIDNLPKYIKMEVELKNNINDAELINKVKNNIYQVLKDNGVVVYKENINIISTSSNNKEKVEKDKR